MVDQSKRNNIKKWTKFDSIEHELAYAYVYKVRFKVIKHLIILCYCFMRTVLRAIEFIGL